MSQEDFSRGYWIGVAERRGRIPPPDTTDLNTTAKVLNWVIGALDCSHAENEPCPDIATAAYLAACVRLRHAFEAFEGAGAHMWETTVEHELRQAIDTHPAPATSPPATHQTPAASTAPTQEP